MSIRNRTNSDSSNPQAKFIQERVNSVEKHFSEFCFGVSGFARKSASLRDKSDELVKLIQNFTDVELINKSLRTNLIKYSEILAAVGDYRNAEIQRLEAKVVTNFASYGSTCKHVKEDMKMAFAARNKELTRKKTVEKLREKNPHNRHELFAAETELQKARADSSRSSQALEEQMDTFERKKIQDLKQTFLEFAFIELSFHAKAMELYTKAYNTINKIDEESDIEDFRGAYADPDYKLRMDVFHRNNSFSTSPEASKPAKHKTTSKQNVTKALTRKDYEDISDDDGNDNVKRRNNDDDSTD